MWVHELRDADASCGGKAVGLAALLRAGLSVPPGFVIADGAFRHIVGELHIDDPATITMRSRMRSICVHAAPSSSTACSTWTDAPIAGSPTAPW